MIVLLDANPIIADRFFTSLPWTILAGQAEAWNLDVRIPRVSFLEAVAHAERQHTEAAGKLKKMERDLGGVQTLREAREEILAQRDRVGDILAEAVAAAGATLVDPVEVGHLNIVQRQVDRVRPCKQETGDGYRDTLNWLTLLDIAASNPETPVVWISDDGDFTGSKSGEFHPDLLAEAKAAGVADRIALFPNTSALAIELLRRNGLPAELPKARLELCRKTVREFVAEKVLPGLVDGDDTDLGDLATTAWALAGDIEVENQGQVEAGTVWAFTAPVQLILGGLGDVVVDAAVTGLVTTDPRDLPTDGEISDVHADLEPLAPVLGPSRVAPLTVRHRDFFSSPLAEFQARHKKMIDQLLAPSIARMTSVNTALTQQITKTQLMPDALLELARPKINVPKFKNPLLDSPLFKSPLFNSPAFDRGRAAGDRSEDLDEELDEELGDER